MLEVSRFFGLIISMYFNDHLPPHFHVRYGSQKAIVGIRNLALLKGRLAPRAFSLAAEWAAKHGEELRANWKRARSNKPPAKIAPLE